ncbi:MAG: M28 family peptidase, partial [Candidatus Omnitrophota bacterium]|nr:M28 family peptidase [Candidatus Omnitrophota bacterium]
ESVSFLPQGEHILFVADMEALEKRLQNLYEIVEIEDTRKLLEKDGGAGGLSKNDDKSTNIAIQKERIEKIKEKIVAVASPLLNKKITIELVLGKGEGGLIMILKEDAKNIVAAVVLDESDTLLRDGELAFLIGHEIGHLFLTEDDKKIIGMPIVVKLDKKLFILGGCGIAIGLVLFSCAEAAGAILLILGIVLCGFTMQNFLGIYEEIKADRWGIIFMIKAGYPVEESLNFMRRPSLYGRLLGAKSTRTRNVRDIIAKLNSITIRDGSISQDGGSQEYEGYDYLSNILKYQQVKQTLLKKAEILKQREELVNFVDAFNSIGRFYVFAFEALSYGIPLNEAPLAQYGSLGQCTWQLCLEDIERDYGFKQVLEDADGMIGPERDTALILQIIRIKRIQDRKFNTIPEFIRMLHQEITQKTEVAGCSLKISEPYLNHLSKFMARGITAPLPMKEDRANLVRKIAQDVQDKIGTRIDYAGVKKRENEKETVSDSIGKRVRLNASIFQDGGKRIDVFVGTSKKFLYKTIISIKLEIILQILSYYDSYDDERIKNLAPKLIKDTRYYSLGPKFLKRLPDRLRDKVIMGLVYRALQGNQAERQFLNEVILTSKDNNLIKEAISSLRHIVSFHDKAGIQVFEELTPVFQMVILNSKEDNLAAEAILALDLAVYSGIQRAAQAVEIIRAEDANGRLKNIEAGTTMAKLFIRYIMSYYQIKETKDIGEQLTMITKEAGLSLEHGAVSDRMLSLQEMRGILQFIQAANSKVVAKNENGSILKDGGVEDDGEKSVGIKSNAKMLNKSEKTLVNLEGIIPKINKALAEVIEEIKKIDESKLAENEKGWVSEKILPNLEIAIKINGDISELLTKRFTIERLDLREIIQSIISEDKSKILKSKITINAPKEVSGIQGIRELFKTIFEELVWNAIKYRANKVIIIIWEEEKNLVIDIKDDGMGIAEENLHRIFSRNYTVPGVKVGTGVQRRGTGLYGVKKDVEIHRGIVDANSESLGKGATFTVRLPREFEKSENNSEEIFRERILETRLHALGNTLTFVIGYSEHLLEKGSLPIKQKEILKEAIKKTREADGYRMDFVKESEKEFKRKDKDGGKVHGDVPVPRSTAFGRSARLDGGIEALASVFLEKYEFNKNPSLILKAVISNKLIRFDLAALKKMINMAGATRNRSLIKLQNSGLIMSTVKDRYILGKGLVGDLRDARLITEELYIEWMYIVNIEEIFDAIVYPEGLGVRGRAENDVVSGQDRDLIFAIFESIRQADIFIFGPEEIRNRFSFLREEYTKERVQHIMAILAKTNPNVFYSPARGRYLLSSEFVEMLREKGLIDDLYFNRRALILKQEELFNQFVYAGNVGTRIKDEKLVEGDREFAMMLTYIITKLGRPFDADDLIALFEKNGQKYIKKEQVNILMGNLTNAGMLYRPVFNRYLFSDKFINLAFSAGFIDKTTKDRWAYLLSRENEYKELRECIKGEWTSSLLKVLDIIIDRNLRQFRLQDVSKELADMPIRTIKKSLGLLGRMGIILKENGIYRFILLEKKAEPVVASIWDELEATYSGIIAYIDVEEFTERILREKYPDLSEEPKIEVIKSMKQRKDKMFSRAGSLSYDGGAFSPSLEERISLSFVSAFAVSVLDYLLIYETSPPDHLVIISVVFSLFAASPLLYSSYIKFLSIQPQALLILTVAGIILGLIAAIVVLGSSLPSNLQRRVGKGLPGQLIKIGFFSTSQVYRWEGEKVGGRVLMQDQTASHTYFSRDGGSDSTLSINSELKQLTSVDTLSNSLSFAKLQNKFTQGNSDFRTDGGKPDKPYLPFSFKARIKKIEPSPFLQGGIIRAIARLSDSLYIPPEYVANRLLGILQENEFDVEHYLSDEFLDRFRETIKSELTEIVNSDYTKFYSQFDTTFQYEEYPEVGGFVVDSFKNVKSGYFVSFGGGPGKRFKKLLDAIGFYGEKLNIDLSEEAVRKSKEIGIPASIQDAQGLKLEAGSVDAGIAAFLLEYIVEPGKALVEINRVLRPGGKVVFLFHYPDSPIAQQASLGNKIFNEQIRLYSATRNYILSGFSKKHKKRYEDVLNNILGTTINEDTHKIADNTKCLVKEIESLDENREEDVIQAREEYLTRLSDRISELSTIVLFNEILTRRISPLSLWVKRIEDADFIIEGEPKIFKKQGINIATGIVAIKKEKPSVKKAVSVDTASNSLLSFALLPNLILAAEEFGRYVSQPIWIWVDDKTQNEKTIFNVDMLNIFAEYFEAIPYAIDISREDIQVLNINIEELSSGVGLNAIKYELPEETNGVLKINKEKVFILKNPDTRLREQLTNARIYQDGGKSEKSVGYGNGITRRKFLKRVTELTGLFVLGPKVFSLNWVAPVQALESEKNNLLEIMLSQVSKDSIKNYMNGLVGLGERDAFSADKEEINNAAKYLLGRFEEMGIKAVFQEVMREGLFTATPTGTGNIIAVLPGDRAPDKFLIVSAHYDSKGSPGANDNASGVAVVLESARILSQYKLDYTIKFVLFTAEESMGRIGEKYFIAREENDNPGFRANFLGIINLDMVGNNVNNDEDNLPYEEDLDITADFNIEGSRSLAGLVKETIRKYIPELRPKVHNRRKVLSGSSEMTFERRNYPALLLSEDTVEEILDENRLYHTSLDNLENIDFDFLTSIAKAVVVSAASLATYSVRNAFMQDKSVVDVQADDKDMPGFGVVENIILGAAVLFYRLINNGIKAQQIARNAHLAENEQQNFVKNNDFDGGNSDISAKVSSRGNTIIIKTKYGEEVFDLKTCGFSDDAGKNSDAGRRLPGVPLSQSESEQERISGRWDSLNSIDYTSQIESKLDALSLKIIRKLFGNKFIAYTDSIKQAGRIRVGPSEFVYGSFKGIAALAGQLYGNLSDGGEETVPAQSMEPIDPLIYQEMADDLEKESKLNDLFGREYTRYRVIAEVLGCPKIAVKDFVSVYDADIKAIEIENRGKYCKQEFISYLLKALEDDWDIGYYAGKLLAEIGNSAIGQLIAQYEYYNARLKELKKQRFKSFPSDSYDAEFKRLRSAQSLLILVFEKMAEKNIPGIDKVERASSALAEIAKRLSEKIEIFITVKPEETWLLKSIRFTIQLLKNNNPLVRANACFALRYFAIKIKMGERPASGIINKGFSELICEAVRPLVKLLQEKKEEIVRKNADVALKEIKEIAVYLSGKDEVSGIGGGSISSKDGGMRGEINISLSPQADFFKGYFFERFLVPKTFYRIENFDPREFTRRIVISGNAFRKMFGSNSSLFKSYVERINFGVICNTHKNSSLKIKNIYSNHCNLIMFFCEYRFYLFSFIVFIIPILVVYKILMAFQPVELCRFPLRSLYSINNFLFSGSPVKELLFSVLTQVDWFYAILHKDNLLYLKIEVKKRLADVVYMREEDEVAKNKTKGALLNYPINMELQNKYIKNISYITNCLVKSYVKRLIIPKWIDGYLKETGGTVAVAKLINSNAPFELKEKIPAILQDEAKIKNSRNSRTVSIKVYIVPMVMTELFRKLIKGTVLSEFFVRQKDRWKRSCVTFFKHPFDRALLGTEWDENHVRLQDLRYFMARVKKGEKIIGREKYNRDTLTLEEDIVNLEGIEVVILAGFYAVSNEDRLGNHYMRLIRKNAVVFNDGGQNSFVISSRPLLLKEAEKMDGIISNHIEEILNFIKVDEYSTVEETGAKLLEDKGFMSLVETLKGALLARSSPNSVFIKEIHKFEKEYNLKAFFIILTAAERKIVVTIDNDPAELNKLTIHEASSNISQKDGGEKEIEPRLKAGIEKKNLSEIEGEVLLCIFYGLKNAEIEKGIFISYMAVNNRIVLFENNDPETSFFDGGSQENLYLIAVIADFEKKLVSIGEVIETVDIIKGIFIGLFVLAVIVVIASMSESIPRLLARLGIYRKREDRLRYDIKTEELEDGRSIRFYILDHSFICLGCHTFLMRPDYYYLLPVAEEAGVAAMQEGVYYYKVPPGEYKYYAIDLDEEDIKVLEKEGMLNNEFVSTFYNAYRAQVIASILKNYPETKALPVFVFPWFFEDEAGALYYLKNADERNVLLKEYENVKGLQEFFKRLRQIEENFKDGGATEKHFLYASYRVIGVHLNQLRFIGLMEGDKIAREIKELKKFHHKLEVGNSGFLTKQVLSDSKGWINENEFNRQSEFFKGKRYIIFGYNLIDCVESAVRSIIINKKLKGESTVFHILLSSSGPQYKTEELQRNVINEYKWEFDSGISYDSSLEKKLGGAADILKIKRYILAVDGNSFGNEILTFVNFWSSYEAFMQNQIKIVKLESQFDGGVFNRFDLNTYSLYPVRLNNMLEVIRWNLCSLKDRNILLHESLLSKLVSLRAKRSNLIVERLLRRAEVAADGGQKESLEAKRVYDFSKSLLMEDEIKALKDIFDDTNILEKTLSSLADFYGKKFSRVSVVFHGEGTVRGFFIVTLITSNNETYFFGLKLSNSDEESLLHQAMGLKINEYLGVSSGGLWQLNNGMFVTTGYYYKGKTFNECLGAYRSGKLSEEDFRKIEIGVVSEALRFWQKLEYGFIQDPHRTQFIVLPGPSIKIVDRGKLKLNIKVFIKLNSSNNGEFEIVNSQNNKKIENIVDQIEKISLEKLIYLLATDLSLTPIHLYPELRFMMGRILEKVLKGVISPEEAAQEVLFLKSKNKISDTQNISYELSKEVIIEAIKNTFGAGKAKYFSNTVSLKLSGDRGDRAKNKEDGSNFQARQNKNDGGAFSLDNWIPISPVSAFAISALDYLLLYDKIGTDTINSAAIFPGQPHYVSGRNMMEAALKYPEVKEEFELLGHAYTGIIKKAQELGLIAYRGPPEDFAVAIHIEGEIWNIPEPKVREILAGLDFSPEEIEFVVKQTYLHEFYSSHDLAVEAQRISFLKSALNKSPERYNYTHIIQLLLNIVCDTRNSFSKEAYLSFENILAEKKGNKNKLLRVLNAFEQITYKAPGIISLDAIDYLKNILNDKKLDFEVRNQAVAVLADIICRCQDLAAQRAYTYFEERFLIDKSEPAVYKNIASSFNYICNQKSMFIKDNTLNIFKTILGRKELDLSVYSAAVRVLGCIALESPDEDIAKQASKILKDVFKNKKLSSIIYASSAYKLSDIAFRRPGVIISLKEDLIQNVSEIMRLTDNWIVYTAMLNLMNSLGCPTRELICPLDDNFSSATAKIHQDFIQLVNKINSKYGNIIAKITVLPCSFTKGTMMFGSDIDGLVVVFNNNAGSEEIKSAEHEFSMGLLKIGIFNWKLDDWKKKLIRYIGEPVIIFDKGEFNLIKNSKQGYLSKEAILRKKLFNEYGSFSLVEKDIFRRINGAAAASAVLDFTCVLYILESDKPVLKELVLKTWISLIESRMRIETGWDDGSGINYMIVGRKTDGGMNINDAKDNQGVFSYDRNNGDASILDGGSSRTKSSKSLDMDIKNEVPSSRVTVPLIGDLKKFKKLREYLKELNNSSKMIEKVIRILIFYSKEEKQILLELGGGNTDVAYAIVKNNKNIGVITMDIYDMNYDSVNYQKWAGDFGKNGLIAQKSPLENLAVVRADERFFKFMPHNSIDFILLVSPDLSEEKFIFGSIQGALKFGGEIIVKPYHFDYLYSSEAVYQGCVFKNTNSSVKFGVDIDDCAFYSPGDPLFIWKKEKDGGTLELTEKILAMVRNKRYSIIAKFSVREISGVTGVFINEYLFEVLRLEGKKGFILLNLKEEGLVSVRNSSKKIEHYSYLLDDAFFAVHSFVKKLQDKSAREGSGIPNEFIINSEVYSSGIAPEIIKLNIEDTGHKFTRYKIANLISLDYKKGMYYVQNNWQVIAAGKPEFKACNSGGIEALEEAHGICVEAVISYAQKHKGKLKEHFYDVTEELRNSRMFYSGDLIEDALGQLLVVIASECYGLILFEVGEGDIRSTRKFNLADIDKILASENNEYKIWRLKIFKDSKLTGNVVEKSFDGGSIFGFGEFKTIEQEKKKLKSKISDNINYIWGAVHDWEEEFSLYRMKDAFGIQPKDKVLVYPCGAGILSYVTSIKTNKVYAIDGNKVSLLVSELIAAGIAPREIPVDEFIQPKNKENFDRIIKALVFMREKYKTNIPKNLSFIQADMLHLPFNAAEFDKTVIHDIEPIMHSVYEYLYFLDPIFITKAGGKIIRLIHKVTQNELKSMVEKYKLYLDSVELIEVVAEKAMNSSSYGGKKYILKGTVTDESKRKAVLDHYILKNIIGRNKLAEMNNPFEPSRVEIKDSLQRLESLGFFINSNNEKEGSAGENKNRDLSKDGGVNVNDEQDNQGVFSYNAEDIIREIERLGHKVEMKEVKKAKYELARKNMELSIQNIKIAVLLTSHGVEINAELLKYPIKIMAVNMLLLEERGFKIYKIYQDNKEVLTSPQLKENLKLPDFIIALAMRQPQVLTSPNVPVNYALLKENKLDRHLHNAKILLSADLGEFVNIINKKGLQPLFRHKQVFYYSKEILKNLILFEEYGLPDTDFSDFKFITNKNLTRKDIEAFLVNNYLNKLKIFQAVSNIIHYKQGISERAVKRLGILFQLRPAQFSEIMNAVRINSVYAADVRQFFDSPAGKNFAHVIEEDAGDTLNDGGNEGKSIEKNLRELLNFTGFDWTVEGGLGNIQKIKIDKIIPEQLRVMNDRLEAVKDYMHLPVTLVKVGDKYYLRNGHHRYVRALRLGLKELPAIVFVPADDVNIEKAKEKFSKL